MKDKFNQDDIVVFTRDGDKDCRYANYGGVPSSRPKKGTVGKLVHINVPSVRRENATFVNIAYHDKEFEDKQQAHPIYTVDTGYLRNWVRPAEPDEVALWNSIEITWTFGTHFV